MIGMAIGYESAAAESPGSGHGFTQGRLVSALLDLEDLQGDWLAAIEKSYDGDLSLEIRHADPHRDEAVILFRDGLGVHVATMKGDDWCGEGTFPYLHEALAQARRLCRRETGAAVS
jgi:hypothetical protein